jgi:hypothetical protein
LAEQYLVSRKLELTADLAGNVLRFHPRCPWRNENTGNTDRIPALLAAFRSIDDDKITAVHRIALNSDGTKIGRRMLGVVHRAAVKLSPVQSGDELMVGEGVETCMAAQQLGLWPAWALGSVGAISFLPLFPTSGSSQFWARPARQADGQSKSVARVGARPDARCASSRPRSAPT